MRGHDPRRPTTRRTRVQFPGRDEKPEKEASHWRIIEMTKLEGSAAGEFQPQLERSFPKDNWEQELRDTIVGSPHDGRITEGRSPVVDWIVTAVGFVLFCLLLRFWVRWTARERELFANGNGRHLE